MKRIIYRMLAYVLDLAFVSVILLGIGYINFVNPESEKINYTYQEYYNINNSYTELMKNIDDYFKDGKLTQEEYEDIVCKYPNFFDCFNDITLNEDIKNKEIDEVKEDLNKRITKLNNDYGYKIEKLNIRTSVISIVVYILYFGLLQYILKGQTIFKKLFKLRVIDNEHPKKKVPLWKYIIRSILVCELIISIVDLILLVTLNQSSYIIGNGWLSNIKYVYEMAFLVTMIIRDDARSIHDLLLNTRVVRFNLAGNIIDEKLFNDGDSDYESVSNKNNKIVSKNANRDA